MTCFRWARTCSPIPMTTSETGKFIDLFPNQREPWIRSALVLWAGGVYTDRDRNRYRSDYVDHGDGCDVDWNAGRGEANARGYSGVEGLREES